MYKGDHIDTFDPFQVVRLEKVREKDGYVRVRKLYRPHDTHMSVREARGKAYTKLYWSEEIGRLYTPAKAAQRDRPSMEAVVGKAWVKATSGGDGEDLQDWTDEGEDRFFICQSYDAQSKTFSPLYKAAVDAVNRTLSRWPTTSLIIIIHHHHHHHHHRHGYPHNNCHPHHLEQVASHDPTLNQASQVPRHLCRLRWAQRWTSPGLIRAVQHPIVFKIK